MRGKKDKKKDPDSTLVIDVNTTNSNSTDESKRKNSLQIICYKRSKKSYFARDYIKTKKNPKLVSLSAISMSVTESSKEAILEIFETLKITLLQDISYI